MEFTANISIIFLLTIFIRSLIIFYYTPLHVAIINDNIEAIRMLLKNPKVEVNRYEIQKIKILIIFQA